MPVNASKEHNSAARIPGRGTAMEMIMLAAHMLMKILLVALLFAPLPVTAEEELHAIWGELLAAHVQDGVVDYLGFKQHEEQLDVYLNRLDSANPASLPAAARLAFYINAYNGYTVKLILANFENGKPVASIKDIGGWFSSPWSIRFARVGGETLTLDNIEHDIIRPKFRDPRVHFAINCASRSCPPLLSQAYTGPKLEEQLDGAAASFLNDRNFTYISGNTLYVSKIFQWFGEDFHNDIVGFVKQYARGELLRKIEAAGADLHIQYLDYDWSLNGR